MKVKQIKDFPDGKVVAEFGGVLEAKRQTGILHISSCCSGKRKFAGGFQWKHKQLIGIVK